MSSPVSTLSCSRTCLAGFGLSLYARFKASNCLAVIVVLGLLFELSRSYSGRYQNVTIINFRIFSTKIHNIRFRKSKKL